MVSERPHDQSVFTQGLLLDGGVFLESVGRYGNSELREVDVATGKVIRSRSLPRDHFGEGVALAGERLIQLTWKEGVAHVWNRCTMAQVGKFHYDGEGWGLAFDGIHLIMSNGSNILQFRDPYTFAIVREVTVTTDGQSVYDLNELEWAEGLVWANMWGEDFLFGIDPANGEVRRVVDARPLRSMLQHRPGASPPEVLNGIAFNRADGTYYLTGKNWPTMFEVDIFKSGATEQKRVA